MSAEHVGSLPVYYDAETKEYWISAVQRDLPCGCTVRGGGNLQSPLTVKLCETHAQPDLLRRAFTHSLNTVPAQPESTADADEAFSGRGRRS